jgi:hypothetical protein
MEEMLIAPCGMNCQLCISYQAMKIDMNKNGFKKTYCEGCLPRGKHCLHMGHCCELLGRGLIRFCFECRDFPCKGLKALDKRYRTKYHLRMIENLSAIQEHGIESLLINEEQKWSCPECGNPICCHNGLCLYCQIDTLQQNKKYRWGEERNINR